MTFTAPPPRATNSERALAHRVAAADGADEVLAVELETKARHELEEGEKIEAGRTFQWASSLSADSSEAQRRLVDAGLAYVNGGQLGRAQALRSDIESFEDGPARSLVLGLLEWDQGHAEDARRWLERVVDEVDSDDIEARAMTARAWAELAEIHITLGQGPAASSGRRSGTRAVICEHLGRAACQHPRRLGRRTLARGGVGIGSPAPSAPATGPGCARRRG